MLRFVCRFLDDALILVGCGCLIYGIWQFSPAAAWIAAGVALVGFGALLGKTQADNAD